MGAGNAFPTLDRTGHSHTPSHSMLGSCNLQLSELQRYQLLLDP